MVTRLSHVYIKNQVPTKRSVSQLYGSTSATEVSERMIRTKQNPKAAN